MFREFQMQAQTRTIGRPGFNGVERKQVLPPNGAGTRRRDASPEFTRFRCSKLEHRHEPIHQPGGIYGGGGSSVPTERRRSPAAGCVSEVHTFPGFQPRRRHAPPSVSRHLTARSESKYSTPPGQRRARQGPFYRHAQFFEHFSASMASTSISTHSASCGRTTSMT